MTNHSKWRRPGDIAGTYRVTVTVRPYDGSPAYEVVEDVAAGSRRDAFFNLTRRWDRLGQHQAASKSSSKAVLV